MLLLQGNSGDRLVQAVLHAATLALAAPAPLAAAVIRPRNFTDPGLSDYSNGPVVNLQVNHSRLQALECTLMGSSFSPAMQ